MGNYTIKVASVITYRDSICVQDGPIIDAHRSIHRLSNIFVTRVNQVEYIKGLYYFQYFPQDPLNKLRFISCGNRRLTSIQFQEITSVFDKWIWMSIFMSALGVTLIIPSHLPHMLVSSILTQFLSAFKALLENGNPF